MQNRNEEREDAFCTFSLLICIMNRMVRNAPLAPSCPNSTKIFLHAHMNGMVGDEKIQKNYAFSLSYTNSYNAVSSSLSYANEWM
jgi:hypothetical protein